MTNYEIRHVIIDRWHLRGDQSVSDGEGFPTSRTATIVCMYAASQSQVILLRPAWASVTGKFADLVGYLAMGLTHHPSRGV